MKRLIIAAILLSTISTVADARGMYCTRHRQACRERDARQAEAAARMDRWYASLSPAGKALHDNANELRAKAWELRDIVRRDRAH